MLRTDRVIPFVAGVGVTTLLVGGIAFARSAPPPDEPAEVVIEQASSVDEAPVEAPVVETSAPEPVDEVETTVLAIGPLSAIEAGKAPPKTRTGKFESVVDEVVPTAEPEKKRKAEPAPKPEADAKKHDAKKHEKEHEKEHDAKKHAKKHAKEHHEKEHDEKKKHHDGYAWMPHVHSEVTSCTRVGDGGATVDWSVRLKGGDWKLVDAGGGNIDGSLIRFAGVQGEPYEGYPKVKVWAKIQVEPADGSGHAKELHGEAYQYVEHCSG